MFFCVAAGLWGGLVIGLVTEYYTSNRFTPVQVGVWVCTAGVLISGLGCWQGCRLAQHTLLTSLAASLPPTTTGRG